MDSTDRPDPTGPAEPGPRADRARRRTFTAEYKTRILAEYDAAPRGERGKILRREGLYDTHLIGWRKTAAAGANNALQPRRPDPRDKEIAELRARAEKAEADLDRTRTALQIVGKAQELLEKLSESTGTPKPPQQ
ncbi:transposase [Kineococcus sp. NBC_00420]|uniref:transposase n=1 Tax=Kineococcus sp. NBC_00420 TaxID=2903564 RepID=UPI002E1A4BF2